MPHKNGAFEPKDPRIINLYEDDDDEDELDDWSLSTTSDATPRPRRKKTGTQALVEFLNTTSPEEFEKKSSSSSTTTTPATTPTKRSSNLFFRRRNKNKPPTAPSSTSSTPTPSSASYLSSSSVATSTTLSRPDVIPSSLAAPNTIHRKNYIEIIPNHILGNPNLSSHANSSTSLSRVASRTPSLASRHSTIRRSIISNSDQQAQQVQSPVLPNNRNPATKQRESSLYSDSIRHSMSTKSHSLRGRPLMRHDTDATFGTKSSAASAAMIAAVQQQQQQQQQGGIFQRRPSEHTFGGQLEQGHSSSSVIGGLANTVIGSSSLSTTQPGDGIHNQQQLEERDRKATETLVNHFTSQDDLETVESALLQRLERFKLSKMDKPSDVVAAGLATEHVRALQVSTQEYESFDPYHGIDSSPDNQLKMKKKKIRHMQVQTMPLDLSSSSSSSMASPLEPSLSTRSSTLSTTTTTSTTNIASTQTSNNHHPNADVPSPTSNNNNSSNCNSHTNEDPMIAQLQQQLAEEQKQRKRLEAALEETCDHFEVLSGMAYQKLRELWEERTRWENACIELRDRLLEMNHHQGLTSSSIEDLNDFANSEYIVEEQVKEGVSLNK